MPSGIVELRVHGVSGMSADSIIDRPAVVRVAGDQNAGFYRVRKGYGEPTGDAGVILEAYQWGNLTAGRAARTLLLLLLLPFMVSNLVLWVRPQTDSATAAVIKALSRVLAATVTAMFVLSFIGIAPDLVGWQCVPYTECTIDRRYIGWLNLLPLGPRLAVLAVVPVLAIRFVWWIGARSARAFEGFRRSTVGLGEPDEPASHDRLDAPGFWNGEVIVGRLRAIHVALAYAIVDLSVLVALTVPHSKPVGWLLIALTVAVAVAGMAVLCLPSLTQPPRGRGVDRGIRWLQVATAVVTLAGLVYASTTEYRPRVVSGGLPGYSTTVTGLVIVQVTILIALIVAVLVGRRRHQAAASALFYGLGAPIIGSLAVALSVLFSTALVYRVADILDRGRIPSPTAPLPPGQAPLVPPVSFRWAAIGGLTAILVVTLSAMIFARLPRYRQRLDADRIVQLDFPDTPSNARMHVDEARDAILKSRIPEQFAPFFVAYFVLSLISLAFTALDLVGIGPTQVAGRIGGKSSGLVSVTAYLTDVGAYSVGLIALGAALIGFFFFRSPEVRRLVGMLWDLGTFWPRSAHPFAPPCYAERAVPEIARRVAGLTRDSAVLLSGHSQGSVLVASAILQMPKEHLRSVALLTHGSPLHRLYARLCPAYFGDDVLCEIGERLDWRWRNLWRDTDPVGGAVFSGHRPGARPTVSGPAAGVDLRLRDPRGVTLDPADTVPPPIEGHWPYFTDPAYGEAVEGLSRTVKDP